MTMSAFTPDAFADTLEGGARPLRWFRLDRLPTLGLGDPSALPRSIKVLLESVLRRAGRPGFTPDAVRALTGGGGEGEIPFLPVRVLLQDFTGVPCVVDLAALRGAMRRRGGDPDRIEPQLPVDLVIDHSVQLDETAHADAYAANVEREYERNAERYTFLRWGAGAFRNLRVLPPGLGICHQVNMERLATVVAIDPDAGGGATVFPDSLVGTDSHTVMVNSMGVLGWGVGGIEAEAAMLGQPMPLAPPGVVGVRMTGRLRSPATATDAALAVTELLRRVGVVGRFVEFFGPGLEMLSVYDRAPIANMAPEYGATTGFFPVDARTLDYLRETGRAEEEVARVERYTRAQGLWREAGGPDPVFAQVVELDLDAIEPSLAGPKRPQDRVPLRAVGAAFDRALAAPPAERGFGVPEADRDAAAQVDGATLRHGAVVIASITSCTNTSNPGLLIAAALLARNAAARGLRVAPHVRTSFAPGSRVAVKFLRRAGLLAPLEQLGFHVAAYGCATCIGNSGPLDPDTADAIRGGNLVAAAVLSGNRNFEGRIHPLTRANYLCSPPLVVAYALKGTVRGDLETDPLGVDADGRPVTLAELWPPAEEIESVARAALSPADYADVYGRQADDAPEWDRLPSGEGRVYAWDPASTYIREPPFLSHPAPPPADLAGARALGCFGDFITTDHISPAGAIAPDSPAARWLTEQGVAAADFNSYGSRRGNHEVMMRGTFANVRLRNRLVEREGGWTRQFPDGQETTIFDAAEAYRSAGVPMIVLAGKMYGAGSSRDWAAKGPALLGVRAVMAESFERIHRSNLIGMGVVPMEFPDGRTAESLGLTGAETFALRGLSDLRPRGEVIVEARAEGREPIRFTARLRVDTPQEAAYLHAGGILPYVLDQAATR
jgi:aconitate hydratase